MNNMCGENRKIKKFKKKTSLEDERLNFEPKNDEYLTKKKLCKYIFC